MGRGAVTAANMLAWWALLFVLYVVLISTVSSLEVVCGAAFGLLGAIAAEAARRAEHPRVSGGRRLAVAAAAFPGTLLRETWQLARCLPRGRATGGTRITLLLPPDVDPAVAAGLLSASPGACVLDIRPAAEAAHGAEARPAAETPLGTEDGFGADQRDTETRPTTADERGTEARLTVADERGTTDGLAAGGRAAAVPAPPRTAAPGGSALDVHLLGDDVSAVERALGARRSA